MSNVIYVGETVLVVVVRPRGAWSYRRTPDLLKLHLIFS